MLLFAMVIAVLASLVAVALGIRAGTVGTEASLWRNVGVLTPSVVAVAGGIMCLYSPSWATYLLGAAALMFGLAENWLPLALVVAAGGIEFYFGPAPRAKAD